MATLNAIDRISDGNGEPMSFLMGVIRGQQSEAVQSVEDGVGHASITNDLKLWRRVAQSSADGFQ